MQVDSPTKLFELYDLLKCLHPSKCSWCIIEIHQWVQEKNHFLFIFSLMPINQKCW